VLCNTRRMKIPLVEMISQGVVWWSLSGAQIPKVRQILSALELSEISKFRQILSALELSEISKFRQILSAVLGRALEHTKNEDTARGNDLAGCCLVEVIRGSNSKI
jgi:hypothetical protein